MGLYQKRKGRRGEQEVAREIKRALPEMENAVYRGAQSRAGSDNPDVILHGYWIEVKTGKQPNPRAALAQAIQESKGRATPLVVIRDDRKTPFAVMIWSDLLELIARDIRMKNLVELQLTEEKGK